MSVGTYQCSQCGASMTQVGASATAVQYRCEFCGFVKSVELTDDGNAVYEQRRSAILSRVRTGMIDWRVASWEAMERDLVDFLSHYDVAKDDIRLQISLVACITNGFQVMDADKYKQCKVLYKATEKMYKAHLKQLKVQANTALTESVNDYRELRAKYKKCRNEYRNTKLLWKTVFFLVKRVVPH